VTDKQKLLGFLFVCLLIAVFCYQQILSQKKPSVGVVEELGSNIIVKDAPNTAPSIRQNSQASTPRKHDQQLVSGVLEGTEIDGALSANAKGELILDQRVRDFFDYFLSTADDIGPQVAIGEIERYASAYLPSPAKEQSLSLLGKYLKYKRYELNLKQTPLDHNIVNDTSALTALRDSLYALKEERKKLFSDEQDSALFGLEDAFATHSLALLALQAAGGLSPEQRVLEQQKLELKLPPELSASYQLNRKAEQQQAKIEQALASDLDDGQLYDVLLDAGNSPDKTQEIIARRQQQKQFNVQYAAYLRARSGLDQEQKNYQMAVAGLQRRFFPIPEDQTQAKLRDLSQN